MSQAYNHKRWQDWPITERQAEYIKQARELVKSNAGTKIKVADVARVCGVSDGRIALFVRRGRIVL